MLQDLDNSLRKVYTSISTFQINMSLPVKGLENKKDRKSSFLRQVTPLNPNAVEFVPSSLRSAHGNSKRNILELPQTSTKIVLDRSDSTTSTNSDDEAGQFWLHRLPEDITPDFTVTEDSSSPGKLSLPGLLIYDEEAMKVSSSMSRQLLNSQVSNGLTQKFRYSSSMLPRRQSTAFIKSATDSRDNLFIKSDNDLNYEFDGRDSKGISGAEYANYLYDNHSIMEDSAINHVQFLALQFPGFSVDRLADLYYANARDLNMTIEILKQLEAGFALYCSRHLAPTVFATPATTAPDRSNFLLPAPLLLFLPPLKKWPFLPSFLPWNPRNKPPLRSCEAYFGSLFLLDLHRRHALKGRLGCSPPSPDSNQISAVFLHSLQVDAGIAENQNSSVVESPSCRGDFPPHIGADSQNSFPRYNIDNMHKNQTFGLCSSTVFRGAPDFISTAGNLASQNSGTWKPERNDPMSAVGGSNGNSQLLNIAYESQAKPIFDNKLQGFGPAQYPPIWLESGDPVGKYSYLDRFFVDGTHSILIYILGSL
ncbi:hypothetical protein KSP40_PGU008790 [Platanthera guangdongensis]|uniref:Uncharacterized protein n=1 Tax=Platanthera guangdongensis TaxID=2320717 RepID=A0ABR2N2T1_9ASPA